MKASKLKSKTYILVGSKEFPECIYRAHDAHKIIKNSSLEIIPNVEHDISQKRYIEAVKSVISKLCR